MYLARSRYVATLKALDGILDAPVRRCWTRWQAPADAVVLAWGRKRTGLRAEAFAARTGLPVLHLEDGFLRSLGPGGRFPTYSVCLDDQGIYYDAGRPSRLEQRIPAPLTPDQTARAARLIALWRAERVSKYNHAREYAGALPEAYVLAVDQTFGDGSIRYGMATAASFSRMLEAALDEHPRAKVLLKVHPEVVSGRKRGHFDFSAWGRLDMLIRQGRLQVLADAAHPVRLLEHAQAVYTVTSQMGFEGLLWGRPVRTFGMPFYAGWGLTRDDQPAPARRARLGTASLEQLVHAALLEYPRYVDPETAERCEAERVIAWMGLQRRLREQTPAVVHACGIAPRQRPAVRALLGGAQVQFFDSIFDAPPDCPEQQAPAVRAVGAVRLVPQGTQAYGPAMTLRPAPLKALECADPAGPLCACLEREPGELEALLEVLDFSPALLDRARNLLEQLRGLDVARTTAAQTQWIRPAGCRRVVLAIGDHPYSGMIPGWLQAVRTRETDAYIVYKPASDVLTTSGKQESEARRIRPFCDEIAPCAPLSALLAQVDAVHVLDSTAGFDALLRNLAVHCHGRPFYAGWGLTHDLAPVRRARRLSLEQLVAGALIAFPTYMSRTTGQYTTPERLLHELQHDPHKATPHFRSLHALIEKAGSAARRAR
ncbi:Capsule polysaccharide biosynthesis protein (plasmid) [Megalodesulfovibrio gigas DSM 1382 = ATCC 19364]|uniref:Capsule polysaccharide biosynthesis protein n=1 Tax=Megalodesulfovibrio gigas (strain ATCC 19364 / DSM 1382 / NCIMB 9332 / VKM B-1759) TaxID=1121448 RepID=T2GFB5_MEGG1|nr:Capsule polysaccharide biosynthesis protein [Megalodesulfovibrio gigas DSM 1382 = ATCC 19364]